MSVKRQGKREAKKRSRAISQIRKNLQEIFGTKLGNKKFSKLFNSKDPKKREERITLIKAEISKMEDEVEEKRKKLKMYRREYCGYYQPCSWIPKRVLSTLLKLLFFKKIYNFIYIKLKLFLCRIYSKF